jgi:GH24 family phage-related lysozyme (muramidase)
MKDATAAAFGTDSDACVGTRMVRSLIALYDSGKRPRVTLLGHSAGSSYVANFLAAMDAALQGKSYATEIGFDVIFMAPAVRVDLFVDTLTKHGNLIRNFRWFSMSDDLEQHELLVQDQRQPVSSWLNQVLGQIYTSSLLYFISGVLEDPDDDTPLVGMQRYFSGQGPFSAEAFPDIGQLEEFFAAKPARQVWSDTSTMNPQPPVGLRCGSHHHGGFPSDGATLESVCHLLKSGDYSVLTEIAVPPGTGANVMAAPAVVDPFTKECMQRLTINEGREAHVYRDTKNIPTVGIGFNLLRGDAPRLLQSAGADYQAVLTGNTTLTDVQIDAMFAGDLANAVSWAKRLITNYTQLTQPRQCVIIDMIFNLGPGPDGFGGFHNTIRYIEGVNFKQAAINMSLSAWYGQVHDRAKRDVAMMRTGAWANPTGDGSDV